MKRLLLLLLFLLIFSCTSEKTVFWCGDHACINKKEKEAYFKKTMTVEVKKIGSKNKKNYSEHEKISLQVKTDTKKKRKNEKEISRELRLEEKMRIKREKELAKQLKLEEKERVEAEKRQAKKTNKKKMSTKKIKLKKDEENFSTIFTELKEKIIQKNLFRPYPDINDIKN